jgi:micrococcal nuclease
VNRLKSTYWFLLVLSGLLSVPCVCASEKFDAIVIGIVDGDTLAVEHAGSIRKIRLCGIDSPEKSQEFGAQAKDFTASLTSGRTVRIETEKNDRYGRALAEVFLHDGRNLNDLILSNGYAWWYQKFSPEDSHRCHLQTRAKNERLGLWSSSSALPPWEFRTDRTFGYSRKKR